MSKIFKWLAGLLGAIIIGVVVWWLTHPGGPLNPIKPPPPTSFLEMVAGTYTLTSWTDAHNGPIELGAKITGGTLQIDRNGVADWNVLVEQTFVTKPGKVRMTARGQIELDSQSPRMVGVQGGEFNKDYYLDSNWGQVSADVHLAVRGWDTGSPNDSFTLAWDSESLILQMKNSRGVFTWMKKSSAISSQLDPNMCYSQRGVREPTKEQLEACKDKGAIIDEESATKLSQSTVVPSPSTQKNDAQTPSVPPVPGSIPTPYTGGNGVTPSQQGPES